MNLEYLSQKSKASRDYSDGPVEDEMLKLVMDPDFVNKRASLLANDPSWPIHYHFTPERANIVNWKDFRPNSKILEIGAGCGAITEALLANVDKSTEIHALELSEKRALINAHRNKGYDNLRIIVGNLEEFNEKDYDYVICIGVLEYAGKFISGENPFSTFLNELYSKLKPGGELILAIENRFGIKYINGAREDHVGRYYESLMGYPQYTGIQTFSKREITDLFSDTGFKDIKFFFPIPDYKLPRVIVNEDYLDMTKNLSFLSRLAPAPAYDQPRVHMGSEQLIASSAVAAGLYSELSNSFLINGTR